MERTCLKCGHINPEASPTALAACPKCGAIYSRVEAHIAKTGVAPLDVAAEAKARAQFASASSSPVRPAAVTSSPMAPASSRRRWFTPGFSLLIFLGYVTLVGLPILIAAFIARDTPAVAGMLLAAGVLLIGIGAVVLELILVVFHMSGTLEDCRDELRANRNARA